jgi:phosphate-selective porin OprO/OprP
MRGRCHAFLLVAVASCWSAAGAGEKAPNVDDSLDAEEADDAVVAEKRSRWNEWDNRFFTLRVGGGFLYDFANFNQDANSAMQVMWTQTEALRDLRLTAGGKLKFFPRVSYSIGYMWDGQYDVWRFRQTGLMFDFPELHGSLFIGRTKEGFSTSKVTIGYFGYVMERSSANEAFIPILADGVKWIGNGFHKKLIYNVGAFFDYVTPKQPYEKNDIIVAARAVWLPLGAEKTSDKLLHLAVEARYGSSLGGTLQFKAKPEANQAQENVVDTGKFPALGTTMVGLEGYYRHRWFTLGGEWYLAPVFSAETHNPFFHGGEVFAAAVLTGEVRAYNNREAFFEGIQPNRPLFSRGPGAWELVLRWSYVDLDGGTITGGRFWRLTPAINWYASGNVRIIAEYGYGRLDRNGIVGGTHFLQLRLQLTIN